MLLDATITEVCSLIRQVKKTHDALYDLLFKLRDKYPSSREFDKLVGSLLDYDERTVRRKLKGRSPLLLEAIESHFGAKYGLPGSGWGDPCPLDWDAQTHANGLKINWKNPSFVNPPFRSTNKWVSK